MMFFMFFCDNNLQVINTLNKKIQKQIEHLEQLRAVIKSQEDLENVRRMLSDIIHDLCATKQSQNTKLLKFIGGLTMIEKCMTWDNDSNRAVYTDINDVGDLV